MKNSNKFIYILIIIVVCFIIGITAIKIFYKSNPTSNDNETIYIDNEENQFDDENSNIINSNSGNIPTKPEMKPIGTENDDFYFIVESVFKITGKGTAVAGYILRGTVKVGDVVQSVGVGKKPKTDVVKEITVARNDVYSTKVSEELTEVQLVLGNVSTDDIVRGQVLAKPNSVKSYKKFDASIYVFSPEDTGYKKPLPITSENEQEHYQYYFRNNDYFGKFKFKENIKTLNPGQRGNITVSFDTDCAMETGEEFFIRSGGHTLGYGKVTKVYK